MKYQRLRDLREDADMNQTEIAKILSMSQTGYSKYETGENDIPTSILIKLAKYYDSRLFHCYPMVLLFNLNILKDIGFIHLYPHC